MQSIRSEVSCHSKYFDLWANAPTFAGAVLNIIIVVLTILIECAVHSDANTNSKPKHAESMPNEALNTTPAASDPDPSSEENGESTSKPKTEKRGVNWCNSNPSPAIRANRLVIATCLVIPLCVAFGLRIALKVLKDTNVSSGCRQYLQSSINTAWILATIFNIIPFIIGCTAWLRAFVDCLFVRWGKTVRYPSKTNLGWPPAAPLWWALIVGMFPAIVIGLGVKACSAQMMGMEAKDLDGQEHGDIELGEEERLMDNIDGPTEAELEGPPAYDANWRTEGPGGAEVDQRIDNDLIKTSN